MKQAVSGNFPAGIVSVAELPPFWLRVLDLAQ